MVVSCSGFLRAESESADALHQRVSVLISLSLLLRGLSSRTHGPAGHWNSPDDWLSALVYYCVADWCLHSAPSLYLFAFQEHEKTPG
jgi:hypothetical protein